MIYGVVLFYTTSAVMRAEKLLVEKEYNIKLIPTPREFSSDCAIALRFNWSQYEQVKSIMDAASVEIANIHRM